MEEKNDTNPYDLTNTTAFGKFNTVATSFNDGLESSILELAKNDENLLVSHIFEKFGNYPQVHKSVNKLLLENKLVLYELDKDSFQEKRFDQQHLKLARHDLSQWVDMAAQPCLTCPIYSECGLNNPVSVSTCEEFEAWLQEEIELEFPRDIVRSQKIDDRKV
ncbi:MAG: hypothetical protein IH840_01195 [Candidatus Heimdallarchaeota archaeon]|nr:hypothetical protein [Candidatus Heimdallarchaeota archaeon]